MKIELPPLPYGDSDLAPHISANTISFHYGKHHKTYVDKATDMVKGTEFADAQLEDIVKATYGKADKKGLFNNAAQAWNHSFYWKRLNPKGGAPTGKLLDKINSDFGELAKLKDELAKLEELFADWREMAAPYLEQLGEATLPFNSRGEEIARLGEELQDLYAKRASKGCADVSEPGTPEEEEEDPDDTGTGDDTSEPDTGLPDTDDTGGVPSD